MRRFESPQVNSISRDSSNPTLAPSYGESTTSIDQSVLKSSHTRPSPHRPWHRSLNPLKWGDIPPIPVERAISGEYKANWLSQMSFQWMTFIMSVGYRRPLELNDIWLVNPDRQIDLLADRFYAAFKQRINQGGTTPLLMALHDTFKHEFWLGAICVLCSSICQVMTPFTLRFLIQWVTASYSAQGANDQSQCFGRQIGLVFAIMDMQLIQSAGTNQFIYRGFMVGAQARGVLISAIFEKALRISGKARAGTALVEDKLNKATEQKVKSKTAEVGWPNGRVMNMMSTDTSRIELACGMFHLIWISPVTIFLALALLLINMTYSALAGFGLLFIGIPLLTITMKILIKRRREINKVTDTRISLTQEIMRSVRFVKYYGWEKAFLEALRSCRKNEVIMIQKLMALRNGMNAVSVSLPIFASMLSFIVYSVSGHELTAALVFSSLSIFNALRVPFNLLPVVIGQLTDAWASMRRLQDYLLAEDQQEDFIWNPDADLAIDAQQASFIWEQTCAPGLEQDHTQSNEKEKKKRARAEDEESKMPASPPESNPFALNNINLSIGRSELVAVIGTVGSGKSSLLSALAGEMRKTSGQVTMGDSRAFCPQYAWIQNATVRDNILFGKDMDREWYEQVIQACALQADLAMLPAGDETEIGERGITLSGGQRQRLNIARAIYFDSRIILLDDPLSAVDAHVGRHLFEHAICGLLSNKCRILATHRYDILRRCNRILWLDNGRIKVNDTYEGLMSNNKDFQELMASTTREETEDKHEDIPGIQHQTQPATNGKASEPSALIQEEDRSVTSVDWGVYLAYIRASGSIMYGILPLFLLAVAQASNILTNLWLSYWTDNKFNLSKGQYIGIYIGLGVTQAILMFSFSLSVSILATGASRTMMGRALAGVLRAPMSFFDTTPLGRITNRFSKDVDTMDNALADAIRMYMYTLAMILSVFILLIFYFHYFGIAIGPLLILFLMAAAYYRSSARDMKRHESVLRSAVFARFSEAISGTASIRAYGLQGHFTSALRRAIDNMNSAYYLTFSNQRWLSTRLDVVSILLVATTGILVVTLRHVVSPSISGLVFSYILAIVQMIQLLNPTRPTRTTPSQSQNPDPNTAPSTSNTEKIGIVGRTGAGKSSIMSALFRLTELTSGAISIDGINIAHISCHDLRSRLSIIPQDPTLFLGTVRSNLDPFHEHADLSLWSALHQVGLTTQETTTTTTTTNNNPPQSQPQIHLDTPVEEEGLNFSLGQRQLMALARALLRGSQIVVCDEATSSVDLETDRRIQETIRTSFKGRTLLCIAHRLQTIIRYDRVCVMDQGTIVELDTPLKLWELGGVFRGMCERSGIVRGDFV
ncbi:ATP-binding cassette transporter protein YOR1-like protein [Aspergillus sclerotiicarbonarius CBS 121057]|uniref:ATP-binding cassette transporter protein YOR1-like protein n=1 Tax=Aspergillus sclerotiicarbonarius (strain CBS 121057 / IBT 28362) TaxID=1448318 RepID=A0A319EMM8_ASPSB|nr:ATP-binding cassette transporter protein YOR1-like protein [Aspergillus sclerotiicarbonarius CBS 121057]